MTRLATFLSIILYCVIGGCGTKETLAEVDFENAKFGLDYIPDRSLEGYNEKYHPFFQASETAPRKYLLKPEDGFQFSMFPKHPALLNGLDVVIVDTVPRTYEKYDRTIALTTLYVDPKLVDKDSWQTFVAFVSQSFSKPDSTNQLLHWMNHGYNVGNESDSLFLFDTIYALVYTDIEDLQPMYTKADGKRFLKVGIDDGIYFKDDTEVAPGWMNTGWLRDSVFYYWAGREELVGEFEGYERNGKKFKSVYRSAQKEF